MKVKRYWRKMMNKFKTTHRHYSGYRIMVIEHIDNGDIIYMKKNGKRYRVSKIEFARNFKPKFNSTVRKK